MKMNDEVPEDREIRYIASLLKARGWTEKQIKKLLALYEASEKEIG